MVSLGAKIQTLTLDSMALLQFRILLLWVILSISSLPTPTILLKWPSKWPISLGQLQLHNSLLQLPHEPSGGSLRRPRVTVNRTAGILALLAAKLTRKVDPLLLSQSSSSPGKCLITDSSKLPLHILQLARNTHSLLWLNGSVVHILRTLEILMELPVLGGHGWVPEVEVESLAWEICG